MPSKGHVNNIMYNRYAESGRVNWVTSFAPYAPPEERQQWLDMVRPRGIGLILKSIKTDFKLVSLLACSLLPTPLLVSRKLVESLHCALGQPVTYPDKITVIHRLSQRPTGSCTSIFLDAVIYSEMHRRVAARCFEDLAVYDYPAGKLSALKPFMVEELQKVYDLQEKNRREAERKIEQLEQGSRG